VQIAPFGSWMQSVGEPYTAIRKAQQYASETVPGTGMAVITDIDMELDIHPKKKQPVGRLALQAMNKVYGETDVLAEAPTLIGAEMKNEELVLHFENAGSGLRLADQTPDGAYADAARLGGLAITLGGTPLDLTDIPAVAEGSTVMLTSPLFKEGVEAEIRLASTGWYRVNLYNSADLPARPAKVHIAP
jgi:sialate O-acetylesterase